MSTPPDQRVLHALRTMGYGTPAAVAARISLPEGAVAEHLLDAEATGWVTKVQFGQSGGWSLTEAGKKTGEQFLAAELEANNVRTVVEGVLRDFLPVNEHVITACTSWQLAEMGMASRPVALFDVIHELKAAANELGELERRLTERLDRFGGYHHRFSAAISRAEADPVWINGVDRESCHRVWFELHEDLIATLGLVR